MDRMGYRRRTGEGQNKDKFLQQTRRETMKT